MIYVTTNHHEPAYGKGYRVLYRGIMAEVIEILIADRDEPTERYMYRIETVGGNLIKTEESELRIYQQSLF
ncbi:MAG: hypothetical protein HGB02_03830 [Chlorobiaceae bacterium]|nr:hypothetical protein [Chlorobiaceae bacterium]